MILKIVDNMSTTNKTNRDYNTISPSAKLLLLMKGLTNISIKKRLYSFD